MDQLVVPRACDPHRGEPAIDRLRRLAENQRIVEQLQFAVSNAPRDLDLLQRGVLQACQHNAWAERLDGLIGQEVAFAAMVDFVARAPLAGLGSDVETMRRLLGEGPARVAFEQALTRGQGGTNNPHGCKGAPDVEAINRNNATVDSGPPPPKPEAALRKVLIVLRLLIEGDCGALSPYYRCRCFAEDDDGNHYTTIDLTELELAELPALPPAAGNLTEQMARFDAAMSRVLREHAARQAGDGIDLETTGRAG